MEAHTCRHCNEIVIDLPDPEEDSLFAVESTLCIDVDIVKFAVQDGCTFFRWALALEAEDLVGPNQGASLDEHIANLLTVVTDDASSDDEVACSLSERVSDSMGSYEKGPLHSNATADLGITPQSEFDSMSKAPPYQLRLHLKSSGMWPRRCLLQRDMTRGDIVRTHPSIYWGGPQLDFVAPKGAFCATPSQQDDRRQCLRSSLSSLTLIRQHTCSPY
jgi:hypothetical protein